MKILFWTPVFWPDIGGIELISHKHMEGLQKRNYDFVVLTSHCRVEAPDKSYLNEIPVYRFPIVEALENKDIRSLLNIQRQVADIKRSFQPDLVHINFGGPAPVSYFHLKTAGIVPSPVLVALHGSLLKLKSNAETILGQVLRTANWTTACSEAMLNDVRQVIPEISGISSTIYYGLPEPGLAPSPLPFDEPHILCLGRLVIDKGFDIAIKAFSLLISRYPQMHITIAGNGSARHALETQVRDLKLIDSIKFIGEIQHEDVYHLINQSTMVIVPSQYREAFGLVALEAAQMERPVVATRVGGLQEAVIHKQTGILVEKENSLAIAEAIAFLLDNPASARQMGKQGCIRARDLFSWERYIDMYDGLYQQISESYKYEN